MPSRSLAVLAAPVEPHEAISPAPTNTSGAAATVADGNTGNTAGAVGVLGGVSPPHFTQASRSAIPTVRLIRVIAAMFWTSRGRLSKRPDEAIRTDRPRLP